MTILCVDDERISLEMLTQSVQEAVPKSQIFSFKNCYEAIELAKKEKIDVAFLDIEMREINGLNLAKKLKSICTTTNIVFVTGYSDYAVDAFGINASGYLMKPISPKAVKNAMDNLRNPIVYSNTDKLRVQCFGNFEVFFNDKPVLFQYNKTKELFAYLVDRRGTICTTGELMAILWEDDSGERKRSYFSNLTADLISTLENIGCSGILEKRRGSLRIISEMINCDYYDWYKGKPYAINSFCGEYMSQFSWAESTVGYLTRNLE